MTVMTGRMRAIVLSLVALGFVAGAAAGVAGDRLAAGKELRLRVTDMPAVLDRLQLTPEQRREADAILARSAPRSEAVMRQAREQLHAVADSVDRELRSILTAEQRTRLDSMRAGSRVLLRLKGAGRDGATIDTVLDAPMRAP